MGDLSLDWSGDLALNEIGDVLTVTGTAELIQRVVRRALTNAFVAPNAATQSATADYFFDQSYGGNLRLYVDASVKDQTLGAIRQRFLDQISKEPEVSKTVPAVVTVTRQNSDVFINSTVTLANNQVVALPQIQLS